MKKFLITLCLALPLTGMAQTKTDITVDSVGKLASKIADADKFRIAELKVSGPLNGQDLKLIQQIVNRSKAKEKEGECLVASIDLSEAVITEGKEGMKTKANTLPSGMFQGAKGLVKAVLPSTIVNISKDCFAN